nr:hypothetical protein Iba_chr06eCG2950 [Ipomoea batatas]
MSLPDKESTNYLALDVIIVLLVAREKYHYNRGCKAKQMEPRCPELGLPVEHVMKPKVTLVVLGSHKLCYISLKFFFVLLKAAVVDLRVSGGMPLMML